MTVDGSEFLECPPLDTDVCIVGTGPAGITLAWYLLDQGIRITLLEGSRIFGDADPNESVDRKLTYTLNENKTLYNGKSLGQFEANGESDFLILPWRNNSNIKERERIYGGTSTHWGGQSRPLDESTFKGGYWFEAWPITRDDLDPHYCEACKFLGLYGDYYAPKGIPGIRAGTPGYNFMARFWAGELGQKVAELDGFDVAMYQGVPKQNLQFQALKVNGQPIGRSKARVIRNASLLNIEHQGGSVRSLTVGVMGGTRENPTDMGRFSITAKVYVLACGAVANARQLLLSKIGNESGLVGRYFMCHPITPGPQLVRTNPDLFLSPLEQDLISYQNPNDVPGKSFPITFLAGLLTPTTEAAQARKCGRCWFGTNGTTEFYHEMIPMRDSQVTLSETSKDPVFKQAQTEINWQLSTDEEVNFERLVGLFRDAVKKKGGGPVDVLEKDWSSIQKRMVVNGHHLGTTRMSAKKDHGVVDRDLKVHTVDNLFIAGSSVWASPGVPNPTFSIVAFSIRLAKHLAQVLKGA